MKNKNVKERVKEFYEEHKLACNIAVGTGLIAIGSMIGWKYCYKVNGPDCIATAVLNDEMKHVLNHAFATYHGQFVSGLEFIGNEPIKLEDMGKLADVCREANCNMTQEITHIIGIGKPLVENI